MQASPGDLPSPDDAWAVLARLIVALGRTTTDSDLFRVAAEGCQLLAPDVCHASIALLSKDEATLYFFKLDPQESGTHAHLGSLLLADTAAGSAAKRKCTLCVPDVSRGCCTYADWQHFAAADGAVALVCSPLMVSDKVLGVLTIGSRQAAAFTGLTDAIEAMAAVLAPRVALQRFRKEVRAVENILERLLPPHVLARLQDLQSRQQQSAQLLRVTVRPPCAQPLLPPPPLAGVPWLPLAANQQPGSDALAAGRTDGATWQAAAVGTCCSSGTGLGGREAQPLADSRVSAAGAAALAAQPAAGSCQGDAAKHSTWSSAASKSSGAADLGWWDLSPLAARAPPRGASPPACCDMVVQQQAPWSMACVPQCSEQQFVRRCTRGWVHAVDMAYTILNLLSLVAVVVQFTEQTAGGRAVQQAGALGALVMLAGLWLVLARGRLYKRQREGVLVVLRLLRTGLFLAGLALDSAARQRSAAAATRPALPLLLLDSGALLLFLQTFGWLVRLRAHVPLQVANILLAAAGVAALLRPTWMQFQFILAFQVVLGLVLPTCLLYCLERRMRENFGCKVKAE